MELRRYSLEHRHFVTGEIGLPLLERVAQPGVIADLGCGDGAVLAGLQQRGLLAEGSFAVDLSPERVEAAKRSVPGVVGVVASASASTLETESVDGVVCSSVIEHMPDDEALAPEIARILRPGGWWYVTTVFRSSRSWWIYRVDGSWALDPTHVREYRSKAEVLDVLAHPQLAVDETRIGRYWYPVSDLFLRALAMARVISHEKSASFYRGHPRLTWLRALAIPPPGYYMIEVAGHRA